MEFPAFTGWHGWHYEWYHWQTEWSPVHTDYTYRWMRDYSTYTIEVLSD